MRTSACAAAAALLAAAAPAAADEAALLEKIEQMELRIQDLEANQARPAASARSSDWTRSVRVGGSADAGFFGGQQNSLVDPDAFLLWDARFFIDAHLGEDVRVGEQQIFRDLGFTFEWDLLRIGSLQNRIGELYADFQGLLGRSYVNFQLGRFQIPVGEAYLLYSQGYGSRPFVSNPVGGPWWWDEGIRFYGSEPEGRFGYVSSVSDGDTPFNVDSDGGKQLTLKLWWQPLSWLRMSASGLRSGEIGNSNTPASGALWLGESWARAFGAGSSVANFQNGVALPDGPNQLEDTWLVAGDTIFDFEDKARLWLAYGRYAINSNGGSLYDRTLQYWIAELILRGSWISGTLRPFYAGLRANALGTYDDDEGYLLDSRRSSTLGYNMNTLTAYSAVLGWELTSNLRLRAEYTRSDIDLVRGVTPEIRAAARKTDYFAVAMGASF
jgi:hypothetical protein